MPSLLGVQTCALRSEEHTSELQSLTNLVCCLLLEKKTNTIYAVVGEEFGLFGSGSLVVGFVVIRWRGIRATVLIPAEFGRYLALGVTTFFIIPAFFNISVVLRLVPLQG